MNEDEEEDERRQRLEMEARMKQVRVVVDRMATPTKPGTPPVRATERRTLARQEQEEERWRKRREQSEAAVAALPPCPMCDKSFSSKSNLVKHCR